MSEATEAVSPGIMDYVRAHARPEDPFLASLRAAAHAAGLPRISIAPEQARLMQLALRLAGARDVVEVGTLGGYSSIAMAMALPAEGRVRTIELEPRHADFAEAWIARSPVAGKVVVHRGAGRDVLPGFAARSADAAFLDADKVSYAQYLVECLRILRPGGLLMVDNAFAFGELLDPGSDDPSVVAIRHFNQTVARHPELEGIIVPLGDGLWLARRS